MKLLPFQQNNDELSYQEIRTFVKLGPECFDSLYLGVRIDADNKNKIIPLARKLNPNIKIYQMETDPKAFKLIKKPE